MYAWQTIAMQAAFLAAEITEMFLTRFGDASGQVIAHFDMSNIAVLQEAESTRWNREKTMVDLVITRNEWRAAQGLADQEGGDKLFINNQETPLDTPIFITSDLDQDSKLADIEGAPREPEDGEEEVVMAVPEPSSNGTAANGSNGVVKNA
jgi:hypothetical protein